MNRSFWKLIVMLSLMGSVAQITKPLGVLQVMKELYLLMYIFLRCKINKIVREE
jgi:hypothetical protein